MREAALGHWNYFTWHLPAAALMVGTVALAVAMARSLRRNTYSSAESGLRWRILGWSSLIAAMLAGVVWPYVGAAARITVHADGTWRVSNYLGVPLETLPAGEVQALRGVDLGGLGLGVGHLEIVRRDGSVLRSVRISRDTLDEARRALGIPAASARNVGCDVMISLGPEIHAAR